MKKSIFPRILATSALYLAAGGCVSCCTAAPLQAAAPQRLGKPTHEEVRRKHIAQAQEKLTRCKERLDNMLAEVEVYGPGQDSPRYAVKAEDMPRLQYIVSRLQANPEVCSCARVDAALAPAVLSESGFRRMREAESEGRVYHQPGTLGYKP